MGYTVLVILILYIPVRSYTVYVNVWSTVVLSNLALRRSFSAYFWNWYNSRRVHRQLLCSWTSIDARNMRSWWLIRSHIPTPMVLLYAFCIVHRDFTMFVTTAARFKSFGPNLKFLQHLRSHCLVRLSTSWGLDDRSRHVSCELVTVHVNGFENDTSSKHKPCGDWSLNWLAVLAPYNRCHTPTQSPLKDHAQQYRRLL